jgi:hypothetical protein
LNEGFWRCLRPVPGLQVSITADGLLVLRTEEGRTCVAGPDAAVIWIALQQNHWDVSAAAMTVGEVRAEDVAWVRLVINLWVQVLLCERFLEEY